MFDILYMLTGNEAKLVVRDAPSGDGFAAWQAINRAYARKTLPKSLRAYAEVISPGQATTNEEVVAMLLDWEAKWKSLEKAEGLELPPMIKMAGMAQLVTSEVRDLIYQHVEENQNYNQMKEKILSWVSHKIEAAKTTPMGLDIGAAFKGKGVQGGGEAEELP